MRRYPKDGDDKIRWWWLGSPNGHADRLICELAEGLVQYGGASGRLNVKVIRGELWLWRHETPWETQLRESKALFQQELDAAKTASGWEEVQKESIRRGHERLRREVLFVDEAEEFSREDYLALIARTEYEHDE